MSFDNVNVNVSCGQSIIKALQNYNTVILKPNIIDNRNVLTQEMISEKHTKYVIKWNYSLEDATINIPKDCIIEFAGGTIDNGTIVGDNTILIYSKPIDEICLAERQGTFIYNTTVADEEDITSESGQLKFKDRLATNGMGRKILRKNIVNGKNILTQDMINKPNTIYVIQYDFTLGEDITVPENCILKFDGGRIVANGYYIKGLLMNDIFNITDFMPKGSTDITDALKLLYDLKRGLTVSDKYVKTTTVYIPSGIWQCGEVEFSNSVKGFEIKGVPNYFAPESKVSGTVIVPANSNQTYIWKLGCIEFWTYNICIENITFSDLDNITTLSNGALYILGCEFCWFKGLQFRYLKGSCIKISSSWELDFDTINIRNVGSTFPKIWFADVTNLPWNNHPNISQICIGTIYYETIDGTLIKSDSNSILDNVTINNVLGEWSSYSKKIPINDISDEDYNSGEDVALIDIHRSNRFIINNINNAPSTLFCYKIDNILYKNNTLIKFNSTKSRIQIGNINSSLNGATETRKIDIINGNGGLIQIDNIMLDVTANAGIDLLKLFRLYCYKVYSLSINSIIIASAQGRINLNPYLEMYNAYKYVSNQLIDNNGAIMYDEVIPGLHIGVKSVKTGYCIAIPSNPHVTYAIGVIAKTNGAFKQYVVYGQINDSNDTNKILRNTDGGYLYIEKDGIGYYNDRIVITNENVKNSFSISTISGVEYITYIKEMNVVPSSVDINNSIFIDDGVLKYKAAPNIKSIANIIPNLSGSTRPTISENKNIGACFFDKNLGKPIYWNGISWVDATGATV